MDDFFDELDKAANIAKQAQKQVPKEYGPLDRFLDALGVDEDLPSGPSGIHAFRNRRTRKKVDPQEQLDLEIQGRRHRYLGNKDHGPVVSDVTIDRGSVVWREVRFSDGTVKETMNGFIV